MRRPPGTWATLSSTDNFGTGDGRRANLDGTGQQTLVGLASSSLVALDLAGGKMYSSAQGSADIRRANLDGTEPKVLITGQSQPAIVTLDLIATLELPDPPP